MTNFVSHSRVSFGPLYRVVPVFLLCSGRSSPLDIYYPQQVICCSVLRFRRRAKNVNICDIIKLIHAPMVNAGWSGTCALFVLWLATLIVPDRADPIAARVR